MKAPGPIRKLVNFRLSDNQITWLDQVAHDERATKSDVVRHALRFAQIHQESFLKQFRERA